MPKEILYVRISPENREYSRLMKKTFGTESKYIDNLISKDRINDSCKSEKIFKSKIIERIKKAINELGE